MRSCGEILGAAACSLAAAAASADAVFNLWLEAPETVLAGSTFTMSVWGEVSGSVLDESDGGFHAFRMDLLASGVSAEFSIATIPLMNLPRDGGTPEPNALRGVYAYNFPGFTPFADDNPLLLFTAEVATSPEARGSMELTGLPEEGYSAMLSWWLDYGDASAVFDTDPGSSRIITPATVNVIPAPASLGLFALAGIEAVRRRRAMT